MKMFAFKAKYVDDQGYNGHEPLYPDVEVQLSGEDGNAMVMVSRTRTALRQAGVEPAKLDEFRAEACSGDYNKVLDTIYKWVWVK